MGNCTKHHHRYAAHILDSSQWLGLSERWRCTIAPQADTDAELMDHVMAGRPCTPSVEHAAGVFQACGGSDSSGIDFLCDGPWNPFPKPKIAYVGGWRAPGSALVDDRHFKLVHSFREVLEGDLILNLQMFHRNSDDAVPNLAAELDWPLPALFGAGAASETVDMATRMSRGGALTWWHLDDGGMWLDLDYPLTQFRRVCFSGRASPP